MSFIFHITGRDAWLEAERTGFVQALSLADEGFIHCSRAHQLPGVYQRYFLGAESLMLLVIDEQKIRPEIKYEPVGSADPFPHVFGALNRDAIVDAIALEPDKAEDLFASCAQHSG